MNEANERMLKCKQCGLELPESEFKQYQSRGQGLRNCQPTGRYTICKHCEKMSAYADKLHKLYTSGKATAEDLTERAALMSYYQGLVDKGLPLVTAPVRRLMGVPDDDNRRGAKRKVFDMIEEAQRRIEAATAYSRHCADTVGKSQGQEEQQEDVIETTTEPRVEAMDVAMRASKSVEVLKRLVDEEFVMAPKYYEERCEYAIRCIREANGGTVPKELESLASEVLDKIDEYVDTYGDGGEQ